MKAILKPIILKIKKRNKRKKLLKPIILKSTKGKQKTIKPIILKVKSEINKFKRKPIQTHQQTRKIAVE